MKKLRSKRGVTLAEMLITVAIILILVAVAAIAVWNYQRSMRQLEFDGIAKEIFVAAQNHLTAAEGQGFLERGANRGQKEDLTRGPEPDIYYFIVGGNGNAYSNPDDSESLLGLMLPFASVDETVRLGGSYVIRYQEKPAQILDVFYSPKSGVRFGHTYTADEYNTLINDYRGAEHKMDRRTYTDRSILGYYGGVDALDIKDIKIKAPVLDLINAERLHAVLTDTNADDYGSFSTYGVQIKLIVTGKQSGSMKEIPLIDSTGEKHFYDSVTGKFDVNFDDVTKPNSNFGYLFCQDNPSGAADLGFTGGALIPGEDIEVKAVAFSNKVLCNIAESGVKTGNSLFADDTEVLTGAGSCAVISNVRHLENLSPAISGIPTTEQTAPETVSFKSAEQKNDLSWSEFKNAIGSPDTQVYEYTYSATVSGITVSSPSPSSAGNFMPVDPPVSFGYEGGGHRISDVTVSTAGNAGLFGSLVNGYVRNVELLDFDIESTGESVPGAGDSNAGALAGESVTNSSTISGVLVRNTTNGDDSGLEIRAAGTAGGLIGNLSGGNISGCAAAVYVSSDGAAGGLVGRLDQATVIGCYSGGHTKDGEYLTTTTGDARVNVIGSNAGGFVGEITETTIKDSYSTCSASGSSASGGFVGAATGTAESTIDNSYCTGLVTGAGTKGAFVGTKETITLSGNHYFDIINEGMGTGAESGVSAIDESVETYNAFMFQKNYRTDGSASPAYAYDDWLIYEFGGNTDIKTLDGLGVDVSGLPDYMQNKHWGDWPSPETKVINEKTNP